MSKDSLIDQTRVQFLQLFAQSAGTDNEVRSTQMLLLCEQMLDTICAMSPSERDVLISSLTMDESSFLHSIALSMATSARRKRCASAVRFGLLAMLFENLRDDYRRTLAKLALLTRSAEESGIPIEGLFDEVREYGSPETVRLCDGYFKGGSRDIRAYGWTEIDEDDGVRYAPARYA